MQSSRSTLHTLHALSRALPSVRAPRPCPSPSSSHQQVRHASWSLSSIRDMFPRKAARPAPADDGADAGRPSTAAQESSKKGLFDAAVEDEDVALSRARSGFVEQVGKPATFHKSSTANFKTSRRKLNDLARLVAGRTADEAILQLQASQKKQAPRLLSMLALARDHAMAKGLRREELVVAQSWVTKGPALQRLDIKGRGRFGVKHHPSSKLHVLLAEGQTDEERRRARKRDQWRRSIRGLTEGDGVGVGRGARPIINAGVGGWSSTPLVPETLLKKRKSTEKSREEKRATALEARKARKAKRQVIFKRAEQYVNEYNKKEREEIRLRRQAKANGDFYVPAQPKVYFVMRTKGINNIAPKPRKILQLLRLLQINNGVFVKVTKATTEMLLRVEPYITYGEVSQRTVRELVYKRGYGKVNKQRIPLSSNQVVESSLGQYGIICVEDIIHEILTVGPHFREVTNFLWPFKLSNPNGGFRTRKAPQWIEGGESGKREHYINALVKKCN
ncbi:hypothetical protein JCM3770_000961 [Rhodotorula araucariae]